MDSNKSEFRLIAKVVAIIDLISSIISLIVLIVIASLAAVATKIIVNNPQSLSNSDDTNKEVAQETAAAVTWVIWLIVAIMAIITAINLWASVQLIKATKLGQQARLAYKFCQYWLVVSIAFLVLGVICYAIAKKYIQLAIHLILRCIFFYVVHCFMRDLKVSVNGNPRQVQSQNI